MAGGVYPLTRRYFAANNQHFEFLDYSYEYAMKGANKVLVRGCMDPAFWRPGI